MKRVTKLFVAIAAVALVVAATALRSMSQDDPAQPLDPPGRIDGRVSVSVPDPVEQQRPAPPKVIRSERSTQRHVIKDADNVLVVSGKVDGGTKTRGDHYTLTGKPKPKP